MEINWFQKNDSNDQGLLVVPDEYQIPDDHQYSPIVLLARILYVYRNFQYSHVEISLNNQLFRVL